MKQISKSFLVVIAIIGMLCTGALAQTKSSTQPDSGKRASKTRAEYQPETIEKAQQALKSKGVYKGEVTGKTDAATKDALKAFQKQEGLNQTGHLNQETRQKLGIEAATNSETKTSTKKSKKTHDKTDTSDKK